MSQLRKSVSVVLTVKNDASGCVVVFDALRRQSRQPDEIVVVDGGSSDNTLETVRSLANSDSRIRLVVAPGANIACGRNLAAAAANGQILACTDAGCRPLPDWLEQLVRPFEQDAKVDLVAGMYRVIGESLLERVVGLATMRGQLGPVNPETFNPSARSMACTRDLWCRLGGWPEWLNYSEDTLFDQKARASGCGFRFVRTAVVEWRPRGSLRAIAKQFYRYGTGRGQTQIGAADFHYNLRNIGIMGVTAGLCSVSWWATVPLVVLFSYFYLWTFHRKAVSVAQTTGRPFAYLICLLVMWIVLASNLVGYLVGSWQRLRAGARFRCSMEEYLDVVGARSS